MTWHGPLPMRWLVGADTLAAIAIAAFALSRSLPLTPAIWAAAGGVAVALPLRRLRPTPVLGVELVAAAAAVTVGVPGDPVVLAVAFALYPVAIHDEGRRPTIALGLSLAAVIVPGLMTLLVEGLPLVPSRTIANAVVPGALTVVAYSGIVITSAWVLGRLVRGRRADTRELIRMRERQAVTEERISIARDVHDIVGHSLSLITMKAAVAEHLAADRPEEGRAALLMIEQIGRQALDDVRSVLVSLRGHHDRPLDLAGIDDLVVAAGKAGLDVEWGRPALDDVPTTVQASAYRLVQEALTNALKYAHPPRCRVGIERDEDTLTISVVNPVGSRVKPPGPGLGILGMKERVALHAGRFTAGPATDGRFEVIAVLPLTGPPAR